MNDNDRNEIMTTGATGYRPKLRLYHQNARGTGCAVQFELDPAHDDVDGGIWITFANQLTIGDRRGPNPTYPRFDWENRLTVRLEFNDITQMLQVFRGECESVNDGHGLFHVSSAGRTKIALGHLVSPVSGYALEVYRTPAGGGDEAHAYILLTPAEALGISGAIESSLGLVCFGLPKVLTRRAGEDRPVAKEAGHAAA